MSSQTKKIKLWITDIDGTIMNYDGSITKRMKELVQKINNSEVKMVLATGRMYMGAYHARKQFNLTTPVVCYQGAVVQDENEILWQMPIKDELVPEILQYLKEKNLHTHLYNDGKLYITDDNKRLMEEYCKGRGTTYVVLDDFYEIKAHNVPKILAIIEDKAMMESVKKELSEKYQGILTIVQSSSKYLEITDIKASKGEALNFLKKYWNLSDDEVLASGDQDNDIDLLLKAGYKASVGQNSKKLEQVAKYHCQSVDSNELVDLVNKLAFGE